MSIHRFKYLFYKYVNRTGTSEETEEFLLMIQRQGYQDQLDELLAEFWNDPANDQQPGDEKAERIFNKIMASSDDVQPVEKPVRRKIKWLQVAAIVLAVSSASLLIYRNYSKAPDKTNFAASPAPVTKPESRLISLPDGSTVILNGKSKVEYAADFNKNGLREVTLAGEAYFDIEHDAARPFIVHTGKLRTTVLGTAFNINASPGNERVVVTVTRGKVKVGDSKRTFNVIVPDEQVVFTADQSLAVKKPVKAQTVTSWTNSDMYFDDVSLKDAAAQLQERFNVSIEFSNTRIRNCRFSATFLKTQTLAQILNIIGEFNNLSYEFKGTGRVVLDGSGCDIE